MSEAIDMILLNTMWLTSSLTLDKHERNHKQILKPVQPGIRLAIEPIQRQFEYRR